MELYLKLTNSKQDRLFQKPQRKAKWFNIHELSITILYENKPIGENMISKMLKRICIAANLPDDWSNHCLRATGITTLKDLGFDDRAVMNLTGNIICLPFMVREFFHTFFLLFRAQKSLESRTLQPKTINRSKGHHGFWHSNWHNIVN